MTGVDRASELRNQILKAKQAYYYGGDSIMSDRHYDALEDELRLMHPEDAVLRLVGLPMPPDAMLTKAPHRIPMGSQSKINSSDEFRSWYEKSCPGSELHMSLKGDGASAAAYYEEGKLKQVISRGDGTVGEDITANAFKFQGLPAYLPGNFTGAIRSEVILTVADWGLVDPARLKNPRNAGTGIMGRKNGRQSELLTCFAFDIDESREGQAVVFKSEEEKTERLRDLGVNTIEYKMCSSVEEAFGYYDEIAKLRTKLPIWIDGLVVKVNELSIQDALGATAGRPKGQVAWKFDSAGAESTLLAVEVSGGHTGALIPNANFSPVEIGGTTVANASLSNWDEVERLGLSLGDSIWVIKANDIIPKVVSVTKKSDGAKAIVPPSQCPFCSGTVGRRRNSGGQVGVVIECQNEECPKKSIGKIKRWIKSVDIQGIGDAVCLALVDQMGVEDAADLYTLRDHRRALAELIVNSEKELRLGDKRAVSILVGIEATRDLGLVDFLGSLGVDRLGKRRVELMVNAGAGRLNSLAGFRDGRLRDPAFASSVGVPSTGVALQDDIDRSGRLIDSLLNAGVTVKDAVPQENLAAHGEGGTRICISGKLPTGGKKSDYRARLEEAGYQLVDTVNAKLSFLVLADPASNSSKAKKARQMEIEIISEERLLELLEQ